MKSNLRLQTNVLCIAQDDERLSYEEIISRLGYFELLEYRRINPVLWVERPGFQWTARQRWEMVGPRGRSNGLLRSLWNQRPELQPMPATTVLNPFEQTQVQAANPEPSNRITPSPPPTAPSPLAAETIISEQDEVITAGTDDDMMVVAPPGTGKTHTLIERISHLVSAGHVDNAHEQVLILSFTRTAVAELRKRLLAKFNAGGSEDLLYVQILTFDSVVTKLLRMDLNREALVSGFSERIAQFNRLFVSDELPQSKELLSKIRFLLVDEVQDLNGHRAKLVLAIARHVSINGGCSMFLGDPAQAIYDFAEEGNSDSAFTSVEFLNQLSSGAYRGRAPIRKEFSEYRRFETASMLAFVQDARMAMGHDGLSPDSSSLDELLRTLGDRLPLSQVPSALNSSNTTAILVRDNLEAYWIWTWCNSHGLAASLWRGARGSYWPGWIARLFLGFLGESISMEKVQQRWETNVAPYVAISFEQAMQFLRDQTLLEEGADSIRIAGISDHLLNSAPIVPEGRLKDKLVISTIHRSKGLEFDDVLLLAPSHMNGAEDVRVVYVAATRARQSLRILERDRDVVRKGVKNGRRFRTNGFHIYGYPEWPQIGLLVDGFDIIDPHSVLDLSSPLEAQKSLWSECAGRERNLAVSGSTATIAGFEIGKFDHRIADDISSICRLRSVANPALQDLRVVDLATVAFEDAGTNAREELGAGRMAIVPVVTGVTSI